MHNKFSKENIALGFYILYFLAAGICYELFPGDAENPNMGIALMYLFIPISLVYFMNHLIRQLFGKKNYAKCLLIHGVAWVALFILLFLFSTGKK